MYICKVSLTQITKMKLKILRIMAIITGLIGTTLINRFIEGGAFFNKGNEELIILYTSEFVIQIC